EIIRRIGLLGLIDTKSRSVEETLQNTEKRAGLSRIILGNALGNIIESIYSSAILFTASYAYADAHTARMAEKWLRLIRTVKDKALRDEIEQYILKGKQIDIEETMLKILESENEKCEAKYPAAELLDTTKNSDIITMENIRLLAKASLLIEKLMEKYAQGNLDQQTIRETEKALSTVMLRQIKIEKSQNTIKIKDSDNTLAIIKFEGKNTNGKIEDGHIAFYYENPVTRTSRELMEERIGNERDIMGCEWAGWNLLPIFGGEIITIKNGEPCFTKYETTQTMSGRALRRTITYHNLFSLANYYETIAGKDLAFQHIDKKLSEIQETLKDRVNQKITEAEREKIIKAISDLEDSVMESATMFSKIEGLEGLEPHYKRNLIEQLEEIKTAINEGRIQTALNRIQEMLSKAQTLRTKIGTEKEVLGLIKKALTSKNHEDAKTALNQLVSMIDDPTSEEGEEVKETLEEAVTYMQILMETNPDILRPPKTSMKDDIKQQLKTRLIVGLMSMLGSIIGYIAMAKTTENGNTAILDMLNFQLPTILWILIAASITILTICILKKGFIGKGKAIALSVAMGLGIWSYAKAEKRGILQNIEFFAPLSGILWVWDEFDDFQDGYVRLKNMQEQPDITDTLELWLLPVILGMFGMWMGIDQYLVATRIPGRWGFAKYAAEVNVPSPWDLVVNAIYEIMAFIFANVIASGARGLGWIVYTIGSILGSLIMNTALSSIFGIVFS
ncbi:MAG: hypothetical protein Q6363_000395, partial [Candidatus Njordarchaeota archaeon]